jgi:hypothetical protein
MAMRERRAHGKATGPAVFARKTTGGALGSMPSMYLSSRVRLWRPPVPVEEREKFLKCW